MAAFTVDALHEPGALRRTSCDTDNFGDPVVLYDASRTAGSSPTSPSSSTARGTSVRSTYFECIAVSKTGDPVNGGWYFYSIETPGGPRQRLPEVRRLDDGIYLSVNMFLNGHRRVHRLPRLGAEQAADVRGPPSPQVVGFLTGDDRRLHVIPANPERPGAGTPPAGRPEFFVSTEQFLNALSIYKFHVDWNNVDGVDSSRAPDDAARPDCWPARSLNASTPATNSADTLVRSARWRRCSTRTSAAPSRSGSTHTVDRGEFTAELRNVTRQRHRPLVPGERDRRHDRRERRSEQIFRPDARTRTSA